MQQLAWLASWFESQCDGDWEHNWGVELATLDNPGWRLAVDLRETPLEAKRFEGIEMERSETDWIRCWTEELQFRGACGVQNVVEMLSVFQAWAEE
jgi:hypothetical protein